MLCNNGENMNTPQSTEQHNTKQHVQDSPFSIEKLAAVGEICILHRYSTN